MKEEIEVLYHNRLVGKLVETPNNLVAFEYSDSWIETGFSINPFSLPLEKKVFIPKNRIFNGLFGVFSDSLPDSWGNLLIKRFLQEKNINSYSELFKLSLVSEYSSGALTYKPSIEFKSYDTTSLNFDDLSRECQKILDNKDSTKIDLLFNQGGSSGGARPKASVLLEGEVYIVKFYTSLDGKHAGKMEYDYNVCAKKCKIDVALFKLLESKTCDGFFASKRFDIVDDEKIHMISVAALLEFDPFSPAIDYLDLVKLVKIITNDNNSDLIQIFRRMCFNVYSHNLDDHGKNFAFLYNERQQKWALSPAYDLTYSNTYYLEHTTSINNKGSNILDSDLLAVGKTTGIKLETLKEEMKQIKENVEHDLSKYINNNIK